jgi:hypothetical protein
MREGKRERGKEGKRERGKLIGEFRSELKKKVRF